MNDSQSRTLLALQLLHNDEIIRIIPALTEMSFEYA
jgi:hypothetical protein